MVTGRDLATTALCLVDYQVAMCDSGPHGRQPPLAAEVARRKILDKAADILTKARDGGIFVIHVRLAFDVSYEARTNRSPRFNAYRDAGAMLIDSPEAQFMPGLEPLLGEPIVTKSCVDPFVGTPLAEMLLGRGTRTLVLAGVATNLAVESAARHATDVGLATVVLEDLCASFDPAMHDFAVEKVLPMFASVTNSTEHFGDGSYGRSTVQRGNYGRPKL